MCDVQGYRHWTCYGPQKKKKSLYLLKEGGEVSVMSKGIGGGGGGGGGVGFLKGV